MMDLSQLSTEDLLALKSGDLSKISTQGLMALRGPSGPAPSGIMKGLNDVAAGGAQTLVHALPEGVVNAVNSATKYVNDLPVIGPLTQMLGMTPATPKQLDQQITETDRNYETARAAAGKTGFDVPRAVGQAVGAAPLAALLPAAPAGVLGRAGVGALAGGTGALLQPVTDAGDNFGEQKAGQVALGAGLGAVATPLLGALADKVSQGVANFFANRRPVSLEQIDQVIRENVAQAGTKWEDLSQSTQQQLRKQAMDSLTVGGRRIDPQAAVRMGDFTAEGMQPTLGQVTRDAGQFAAERNLRTLPGAGDPLLQRFQAQGTQLQNKIGQFAAGANSDQAVAANKLAEALRTIDEQKAGAVRQAYQAARETAGKDAEVPLQGLAQDVADIFDRYRTAVPSGIRGQFSKLGLDPNEVVNQRKIFTVEEADKLLKEINRQGSNEPAVQSALGELRSAVKRAVTQDAGVEDVFAPARKLAAERFGLQEAVPALEAASRGTTAPDDFVRRFVLNGKPTDVNKMADLLRSSAPDAFQEARSQIGLKLQRAAFGNDVVGDAAFNPKQFAKVLNEMGDTKLGAFFSPDEVAQLHRLSRIGAYINQAPSAAPVNNSNNWGAIMTAASRIPGVPAIVGAAKAAGNAVGNQMAVSRALQAKVPVQPAEVSPEAARALARMLTAAGMGTGAISAQ